MKKFQQDVRRGKQVYRTAVMQKQSLESVLLKRYSRYFRKSGKEPCTTTLLKKEILIHTFSCEYCETFQNTYFVEHHRPTISVNVPNKITTQQKLPYCSELRFPVNNTTATLRNHFSGQAHTFFESTIKTFELQVDLL